MAIATYKDLCIDAVSARPLGGFYAAVLGLEMDTDDDEPDAMRSGPTPRHKRLRRAERELARAPEPIELVDEPGEEHKVFINPVPEPKTVKNRVHIDVHARSIDELTALGATVLNDTDFRWVVMADPEGQEFCAFVREQPPEQRLYAIVVDCGDPEAIAQWWGQVFDVEIESATEFCVFAEDQN